MKFFTSVAVSAGLVVAAGGADAQMLGSYEVGRSLFQATSDFDGPYGPPPLPSVPVPRPYGYGPNNDYAPQFGYGPRDGDGSQYGYGPALMPLPDLYAVLRENGFAPLGIPHQRGFVYIIAALDRTGQDGRLVIDGRSGQIIRFTPAYRRGLTYGRMHDDSGPPPPYRAQAGLPPPTAIRAAPPPASVPQVASRNVPMPASKPPTLAQPATTPQQSAAVETKAAAAPPPAQAAAAPPAGATVGLSKPAPQILPTREMPKAQGLD